MHAHVGSDRPSASHRIENNPYLLLRNSESISEFLVSIIDATDADFGNVQLFDSTNQVRESLHTMALKVSFSITSILSVVATTACAARP